MLRNLALSVWLFPRRVLIALVSLYQATLSPDHGPLKVLFPHGYCRHEPTCSMYAKKVLRGRGAIVGSLQSIYRVLRCNPWTPVSEEKVMKIMHR